MSALIRKSVMAMQGYVPGEQPHDAEIIKLNTNENPYLPSPEVYDILREINVATLARYPDPQCIELRKVIAQLHGCEIDQVFVGNGSDEILALALRAYVERDEVVGFLEPSYSLYPILAEIEEIKTRSIPLDAQFGWKWSEDFKSKLFLLTHPNAPTSLAASREQVEVLVKQSDGIVLIDEAYADFAADNYMDLALSHSHVLVTRSLSKSYSLAGIRCGYAIGDATLIQALYTIKDSYNVNYITQELARVALLDQDTMKANVEAILETRNLVAEKLLDWGVEVLDSQTNFLWIKPTFCSAKKLFEQLREKKILVRYFEHDVLCKDYVRISIGTAPEMFNFLDAVEQIYSGSE
jgi:histidinol-phosphate aminotransferase